MSRSILTLKKKHQKLFLTFGDKVEEEELASWKISVGDEGAVAEAVLSKANQVAVNLRRISTNEGLVSVTIERPNWQKCSATNGLFLDVIEFAEVAQ